MVHASYISSGTLSAGIVISTRSPVVPMGGVQYSGEDSFVQTQRSGFVSSQTRRLAPEGNRSGRMRNLRNCAPGASIPTFHSQR